MWTISFLLQKIYLQNLKYFKQRWGNHKRESQNLHATSCCGLAEEMDRKNYHYFHEQICPFSSWSILIWLNRKGALFFTCYSWKLYISSYATILDLCRWGNIEFLPFLFIVIVIKTKSNGVILAINTSWQLSNRLCCSRHYCHDWTADVSFVSSNDKNAFLLDLFHIFIFTFYSLNFKILSLTCVLLALW